MASIVISKRFNGEYKFVFTSRKGKAIFTSLSYADITLCEHYIQNLKNHIDELIFTKHRTASGKYFFKLLLHEVVQASSRRYTTELLLAKAINEIKLNIVKAEVLDFSNDEFVFPDFASKS